MTCLYYPYVHAYFCRTTRLISYLDSLHLPTCIIYNLLFDIMCTGPIDPTDQNYTTDPHRLSTYESCLGKIVDRIYSCQIYQTDSGFAMSVQHLSRISHSSLSLFWSWGKEMLATDKSSGCSMESRKPGGRLMYAGSDTPLATIIVALRQEAKREPLISCS